MDELEDFKVGHRKRIREKYIENKNNLMNEYEVLELLLTYAIPRKDVKPIAKKLLKSCGGLYNVLNTSIDNLSKIEGIGVNTAVLISLIRDINARADKSINENVVRFDCTDDMKLYFVNLLSSEKNECMAVVSLDNDNRIINKHIVSEGCANSSLVDPRKIFEALICDNASSAVIAHNHPRGSAEPSGDDISFTLRLRDLLKPIGVNLVDHIIVGEKDVKSVETIKEYSAFFHDL